MPARHRDALPALVWPSLLLILAAITVLFPAAILLADIAHGLATTSQGPIPIPWPLVARTIGIVALVTALCTLLAWPVAWSTRHLPARALILLLVPMLLPSYLSYAGWGLIRAPDTWLGNLILSGPPGSTSSGNWYPIAASRIQAIAGLVLWGWPLPAIILAIAVRRLDPSILDNLRLEPLSPPRRTLAHLSLIREALLAAAAATALVMLGSVVPLHVAQFDTYAIALWRHLDEIPYKDHWRIWAAAWPLVLIALAGTWAISRRIAISAGHPDTSAPARSEIRRALTPSALSAATIWSLSVLAPLALLLINLRGTKSLTVFWRTSWPSMQVSLTNAAALACIAALMTIAVWFGLTSGAHLPRKLTVLACALFLAAGLSPGILVGSSIAHAFTLAAPLRAIADTSIIIILGHTARFGFLACLGGWYLARSEPAEIQDNRILDSGLSFRGWVRASLTPQAGVLAACALATGLLGFHEIEASIMLQPPSSAGGGFAWKMLQALHFNREEDLVAAMVTVVGVGLIASIAIVALWPRRILRKEG